MIISDRAHFRLTIRPFDPDDLHKPTLVRVGLNLP
jgi:hypothetical protein